ncbi:methyl-accepting chemotaxis protein [Vitreimonas flagellata]|uniref:methyl-accepting chemotaxis protein n=1 Tax=Vitreimonas flagellata TaxID=2560861 RepID=UPI001074CA97|nr:methyl-accepting chemotaxis protein [Vitreimonas flagellata]
MFKTLADQRVFGAKLVSAANWLFVPTIGAAAFFLGDAWLGLAIAATCVAGFASLVMRFGGGEAGRLTASAALMAQVSLLVAAHAGHAWQIDMHMTYFAALAVLTIFCDWRAILAGAGVVAVHHLTLNFLIPAAVFPGGGDFWRVVVHAVILIVEAVILMGVAHNISGMFAATAETLERAEAARAEANKAQAAEASARIAEQHAAAERAALQKRIEDEQADVVARLASGLERLAQGDLTAQITSAFPSGYEKLRGDFNAALRQLRETMADLSGAVDTMRSGAGDISQATDEMSRRTESQAASLEESSAALDEITVNVRRTADNAKKVADAMGAARSDADKSGAVVADAIEAMRAIEGSSKQISQIIGVIDEIAFQTNLLALNAGVEAARAGEAGRGFAVVATEVRALAQRSASAARDIKELIQNSEGLVDTGVGLVGQTGEALTRIASSVGQIDTLVQDIAESIAQQSSGLVQVNAAVDEMDRVTQSNAAMVEQSAAASHALSDEAAGLAQKVGRFRIADEPLRRSA